MSGSIYRLAGAVVAACTLLSAGATAAPVRLELGELVVTLSPENKWTMRGIQYGGVEVGQSNGNYGTVVAHESAQFIGAGHTEGGEEEVVEVALTRDGQPWSDSGATVVAAKEKIERVKKSTLGKAFELESHLTVGPGRIDESITVKVVETAPLVSLYPLMLIWNKESSAWAATTKDGRYLTGTLVSDGEWRVQEDLRWLALYHPSGDVVTLTIFPDDFPAGMSRKHAIWDHPSYHKQYFIAKHRPEVQPGEEFRFSYTVHFLKVNGEDWQGDVEKFVSTLVR